MCNRGRAVHVSKRTKAGAKGGDETHPERLLGKKVRVSAPGPQTARAKPARGVGLDPREACARPVVAGAVRSVFPRVERELLVVRGELEREKRERDESQDAVREGQGARVGRCDQRGSGNQEQEDVLDRRCETEWPRQ